MKFTRDSWLAIGILLALILVTSAAVMQKANEFETPYLSTSASPKGTLAFKLWLIELGFEEVKTLQSFDPDKNVNTIFILQPIELITDNEWKLIDKWVETGGKLILAGDNFQTDLALSHYDFSLTSLNSQSVELSSTAPILKSPHILSKLTVGARYGIQTSRSDFTPLASAQGFPIVVTFNQERGQVFLSSTPDIFSNLGLKDDTVAILILNIMALTDQKGTFWFDEWHHGLRGVKIVGPWQWLRRTPGGRSILFTVGVIFLGLLIQGRAFGRPVPLKHEIKKRGPLEHVTAIANLNRKAGHRNEVLAQYHHQLKRHLGHRYHIDPSIDDEEYVRLLSGFNSAIDPNELLYLLRNLSRKSVSETDLVKLVSEVARWMDQ